MSRYPYTEACDGMRLATMDWSGEGAVLSRFHASLIRKFIADAIGMDDEELACKIAVHAKLRMVGK